MLLLFLSIDATANTYCDAILKKSDIEQGYIDRSRNNFEVISNGRLYFYSAPDDLCMQKESFLVPGDQVVGYSEYNGFLFVAYFKKNGDSVDGWLKIDQLKNTEFSNGPSGEEQMVFNMIPEIINNNKLSSLNNSCFIYDMKNNNEKYYEIIISLVNNNKKCTNDGEFPFTILIKKKSLEGYTNKSMKTDEFRSLNVSY